MTLATHHLLPFDLTLYMSRYGEAIRERREFVGFKTATACAEASARLELEDPASFRKFSQSSLSRWELDKTGEYIEAAHGRSLKTLAYLLQWTSSDFEEHVGISIGTVPRLEHVKQARMFTFLERFGEKARPRIRVPVWGSLAAGIKGFEIHAEPDDFMLFDPAELPKGIQDHTKLYVVRANGTSMYEEDMKRAIPDGSALLVEADAQPLENQIVVAYIPERDLGVVKQYQKKGSNVLLRSYQVGGPAFWSHELEIRIEGVVRRVIFEP